MQTVWFVLAAIAGAALGFWFKRILAKDTAIHLERDKERLNAELSESKDALARVRTESESRASFQAIAIERQGAISRLESERSALREELRIAAEIERDHAARISKLEAELKSERENLAEKLAILENAKQALANQFEALAGKILDEKSKTFSDANKNELGFLLTPLRDQIKDFREKVEQAQKESGDGVTTLKTLIGALSGLNQQLSEEARNLSTALRGSAKAQGDWGEFILRDLLEKAGLREGDQYSFQQKFIGSDDENGDKGRGARTDVIVSLPGGRHLVIDSKVSLKAYTDSMNAETEPARQAALVEHLKSVRSHVAGLAQAGYQTLPGIECPDFVVMFVPVEPAFLLALQSDPALWPDAYRQGILLVGPTTLLYVIRIVTVLWDSATQVRNVKDVMDRGTLLYEKFVGFINDLESVGKNLRGANQSYEAARKKLSEGQGNLVFQVEELRKLGVQRKPQPGPKKKPQQTIPLKWLTSAGVGDPGLELAAEAEESGEQE